MALVMPRRAPSFLALVGLMGTLCVQGCFEAHRDLIHLKITTEPSDVAAGLAISPAVKVSILDVKGRPVPSESRAVTLTLRDDPGGATLSGTTTRNAVDGVATFADLSLNRPGTGYTLTASADGLNTVISTPFNVSIGAAALLSFEVHPANSNAGLAISPAVTVRITDSQGNLATASTAAVTIAIGANPGGSVLSGTLTRSPVAGIATFNDLSLDKPGVGYTLTASAPGLTGATSAGFSIAAGTPSQLVFSVQPSLVEPGKPISPAVVVEIRDSIGNLVTTAVTPVTIVIGANPGGATLSGTLTRPPVAGISTFNDLSLDQLGSAYTLTATLGVLAPVTSSPFNVVPDATPPAAVTNLYITSATTTSISLSWTAPGDDGTTGTATIYDLRTSPSPIDSGNWSSAAPVAGEPPPGPPGTIETFTLSGLTAGSTVYVALKTLDELGNASVLSNVVRAVLFTPKCAYVTNKTPGNAWALFAAGLDGATQLNLSEGLPYARTTFGGPYSPPWGYQWSPDGEHLAFLADTTSNSDPELYVVNSTGGIPVRVCIPMASSDMVRDYRWSPDGAWIAYVARIGSTERLFACRPDGSQKLEISGPMSAPWGILQQSAQPNRHVFAWAPDSSIVAYVARQAGSAIYELYTVHPDGTANVKVSAITTHDVLKMDWAPDGSRIAFVSYTGPGSPDIFDLYTTLPGTAAGCVVVTNQLVNNAFGNLRWAPDGSKIAYLVDTSTTDLWMSVSDGSGAVQLNPPLAPGRNVGAIEWSPVGDYVAYVSDQDTGLKFELYTVAPAAPGLSIKVSNLAGSDSIRRFRWSPDGARIGYCTQSSTFTLHATLPTGNGSDVVVAPGTFNPIFDDFSWAPDSSRIAYIYQGLFTTLPTTIAGHIQVSPIGVPGSGVGLFADPWSTSSPRLFYLADLDVDSIFELYATDATTSANNLRISGPIQAPGVVNSFQARP